MLFGFRKADGGEGGDVTRLITDDAGGISRAR